MILEHPEHGNIFKLAKGLELLAAARVRKIGYQKWDKFAVWFSNYEQAHNILIINKAIDRLEEYCRNQALIIYQNI